MFLLFAENIAGVAPLLREILYRTAGGKRNELCGTRLHHSRRAVIPLSFHYTVSLLNKFAKMVLTFQKFLGKALLGRCPLPPIFIL